MTQEMREATKEIIPSIDDLISIKDASEKLGIHHNTLRKLIREEKLRAYILGKRSLRVSVRDLSKLLKPYQPGSLGMWSDLL